MRELTPKERDKITWMRSKYVSRIEAYKDLIREMEPDLTYALSINGATRRGIVVMMNRAAKALDIELRWAAYDPKATELFVELKG
jgi:hypothetical protein